MNEPDIAAKLVQRIVDGDVDAEREMVERYQRGLTTMLRNRCKDYTVADDVGNDTWIVVITKIRKQELRDASKLAAFIVQIGKNQLLMHFRKQARYQGDDIDANDHSAPGLSPEQELENKQLGNIMGNVLGELSKSRDREILTRVFIKGETKKDLCKTFRLTEAHFDRVLHRARKRFRELWDKQMLGNQT